MFPKQTPRSKEITVGVFHGLWCFAALIVFCYCLQWLTEAALGVKDDSDQSSWSRSGMDVMTDARTGCQYLGKGSGITPRLDTAGNQICR